jgi:hypothetical protein
LKTRCTTSAKGRSVSIHQDKSQVCISTNTLCWLLDLPRLNRTHVNICSSNPHGPIMGCNKIIW